MKPGDPLRARIASAATALLTQGLSADRIALTVAVGLCIAIIPVVGVTTILSFAAAWALRLNQPIIQTINWSSYALQLLLIVPFIRMGENLFRAPRMALSLEELAAFAKSDPFGMMLSLSTSIGHAVVAWLLVIPFVGTLAFLVTRPLVRSLAARIAAAQGKDIDDVA